MAGPAFIIGLPPISEVRCMQGPVPDNDGLEAMSHLTTKVWRAKRQACSEEAGINAQEVQEFSRQQFFADSAPSWRHKNSRAVNNRHRPAWVDSQLPTWDTGMKMPPESVSTSGQRRRVFDISAPHESHLEVGMCRKLCEDGLIDDAVDALNLLVQRGYHVHNNLFYRILKRCIANKDLVLGRCIHDLSIKCGFEGDAFLATHLIGLYASHGRLDEALRVFTKVSTPDVYNWATIIFAYARHGEAVRAIGLYRQMRQSTTFNPTDHIYVAVLKACAAAADIVAGKEVHAHILSSPGKPNIFVQTSLVDMYAKCRSIDDARNVFDRLPERNVVTWNALLAGYAQQGMGEEALSLYNNSMQQEGIPPPTSVTFVCLLQACASVGVGALQQGKLLHAQIEERKLRIGVVLGTCLIDMYSKCGSLDDARRMFDRLGARDVVTWNAMLAGYAEHGMGQEALCLYGSMQQEGVTLPNSVTFVCLLQACAILAALPSGKQLHTQIEEAGLQADMVVGPALVNMYAKCGSMSDSQKVFDSLPKRTVEAWGALAGGYARQGESQVVFDLLDRMRLEGIQPDGIMFLSVLTVCSHVGLVNKGREYFRAMSADYGISPTVEHYTCMMDLLGRAGHLKEALWMAKAMPFPPDAAVWVTLLGACRKWKDIDIGRQAFEFAVSVGGKDASSYVLMSNIYASAQMWEEAKEMQARRVKSGAWKKPGQSWWTDPRGVVHIFAVGDKKHPESKDIYARLEQLVPKMKKEGYVPHLDSSLRDLSDGDKEADLCGHSEKLAIAYALHKTPEGTTIRVVKNLRVCVDCHTATAYISKVEKRTIICRDASRFHVYKEGKCSCGDYW